jgi:hypothetical protein
MMGKQSMQDDKTFAVLSRGTIVGAILVTLLWGVVAFFLLYYTEDYTGDFVKVLRLSVFYTIMHPVIGRLFSAIVHLLCVCIDYIYHLTDQEKWSNWSLEKKLWMAVFWPFITIHFFSTK